MLFLIVSALILSRDKIIVDESLRVNKTTLAYDEKANERINCLDMIKGDTIEVYLSAIAFEGYTLNLKLIGNKKAISMIHWSDYGQFDGRISVEMPLKKFELYINKDNFKQGDTLKAKFSVKTAKDKYYGKVKIDGTIYHIIGGNLFRWKDTDYYKDPIYKNGFPKNKVLKDSL